MIYIFKNNKYYWKQKKKPKIKKKGIKKNNTTQSQIKKIEEAIKEWQIEKKEEKQNI